MNHLFTKERIERILRDLSGLMFHSPFPLSPLLHRPGRYETSAQAQASSTPATVFESDCTWGGRNSYCWLSITVDLPEQYHGQPLWISVATELPEGEDTSMLATFVGKHCERWDLMNPQFLLFINSKAVQGLDANHLDANIEHFYDGNGPLRVDFQGYAGMTDRRYGFFAQIRICDKTVRTLYYDLLTAFESALSLDENDPNYGIILNVLNQSLNLLDLRKPRSNAFYHSIAQATRFVRETLYDRQWPQTGVSVTCFGHTHIDVAWLWDLAQTRDKARRSFSTVLSLMEQYPDFTFLQSQPQLYDFVKHDHPELYEQIRTAVQEGRWEPEGAMWLEPDCNLPSGESLVRQLLYGKRFFREEFGRDTRVLWLPDVFGYSAALPQILKKSGIDGFITSKISWNMLNKMPYDTFAWRGIDGTEVLTHFITTPDPWQDTEETFGTVYNAQLHPSTVVGTWKRYQQKGITHDMMLAYGYGDGGGGPTEKMLEKGIRLQKGLPGMPALTMGHLEPYFKQLRKQAEQNPYLPRWVGELYLELHQGTYTSMAEIKKNNRKTEILLHDAEFFQSFAYSLGEDTRVDELAECWRTLLLNQFHDILPGSCIEEAYRDSRRQFHAIQQEAGKVLRRCAATVCKQLDAQPGDVAVFNTLSFTRDDLAIVPLKEGLSLADEQGQVLLAERLDTERVLVYVKDVPAFGCRILHVQETQRQKIERQTQEGTALENRFFRVEFDECGNIARLYDKTASREVLRKGALGNELLAFDDRPSSWDTWNIDMYYEEKCWPIRNLISITPLPASPVRHSVRIHRRFQDSDIVQIVSLYTDIPRIDFETEIDWRADAIALKAAFPVDINSDYATYEIQFGNVRRPTHANTSWDQARYEVCAHKWADLSETGYGVSLLNDCKYGHDIRDGVIRLTLLKTGMTPFPQVDRGHHSFAYSLFPHMDGYAQAGTVQMAQQLNVPLRTFILQGGTGGLDIQSLVEINNPNILIDTIKPAEDGNGLVLRLYESVNSHAAAIVRVSGTLLAVQECDLLESPLGNIAHDRDSFRLKVKPFEVKTIRIAVQYLRV